MFGLLEVGIVVVWVEN